MLNMNKKLISLIICILIFVMSSTTVFAEELNTTSFDPNIPTIEIADPQEKLYLTLDDVGVLETIFPKINTRAIWMTYGKAIYTSITLQKPANQVTINDFPSSIEYSEPAPYSYCDDARGTLYIENFYYSGYGSSWYVVYAGTMGYFLY